jgi:two-component system, chemotaxis family, CheB/CheR fusion protein
MRQRPVNPRSKAPDVGRSAAMTPAADQAEEALAAATDDIIPSRGYSTIPVVGLGGSAGSLAALQAFFRAMPDDTGMAFVVVIHLSSEHESKLAEILQRETKMPVAQVQRSAAVEPNHVYVVPPGKGLESTDGRIELAEIKPERGRRVTVDQFFRTLGDVYGPHATAVVLSGADSDGSIGVKRVKERGGLTIAQDPDEAQQHEMPRSAIATGMIDWVLPAGQMPVRLIEYRRLEGRLDLPPEDGPQPAHRPSRPSHGTREAALHDVLAYLRTRTGRDFSYYKRATIVRRIARRMQVNGVEDLPAYLNFLRTHAGEPAALLQDLLISVTNFFRDPEAFAALEAQIPRLFAGKGPDDVVRVWVVACATGEEAYSIAMLLHEHASKLDGPPRLQIFATDLDNESIRLAREAFYPLTIAADVSEPRLKAFFRKEAGGYRLLREIRETVLFAVHDVLRDSPFSKLDLVSCRNLMIYLDREAQARLVDVLHFALKPGGLLFLATSEAVDEESARFKTLDKKHRLYEARPGARAVLPLVAGTQQLRSTELVPVIPAADRPMNLRAFPPSTSKRTKEQTATRLELHLRLIERLGPPSVLVNGDYDMLHLSPHAGRFLQYGGGEINNNLLRAAHPQLRPELRAALVQAKQSSGPVTAADVPLAIEGQAHAVTIRVAPAGEVYPDALLVTFDTRSLDTPERGGPVVRPVPDASSQQLEAEIERLSSELNDTAAQYDSTVEDLKASNEELQAMNEELRSATEELETSREELQSINEELRTVNQEIKENVEELGKANSDLQNLMAATNIPTLFLDQDLRVMRYTPPAVELFNLIGADVGRPITDITNRLVYPDMMADAQRALVNRMQAEREVRADQKLFLARVLPYWAGDDRVMGVVFTFLDITDRKRAEDALRDSEQRLRLMIENARDYAIFALDLDRRITSWNSGAQHLLGYEDQEILGQRCDQIYTEEDRAAGAPEHEAKTALAEGRAADERWHQRKDGSRFWGSGAMMLMTDEDGHPIGFVKILRDETDARLTHEALDKSRDELRQALADAENARHELEVASHAKDHFLAVLSHELRTPLTPVLVAAQSLAIRTDLPKAARDALEIIRRNVRTEAQLIDDLLDLTRIARGQMEVVREPVDLHEVIKSALDICESDFRGKNHRLTVSLAASEHALIGDFRRLQQVVWNLLKNASKFTPPGGEVSVSTRSGGGRFELKIVDSGMGIEPEQLSRVFEPFVQGGAWVVREHGGLGLGLAISKATVDAHGGKLHAESEGRGRGATFSVELPLNGEREGE